MEKFKNVTLKRTQNIIFYDKLTSPANFKETIKLEIFAALSSFMSIKEEDIKLAISLNKNGKYRFDFSVETDKVKPIGITAN